MADTSTEDRHRLAELIRHNELFYRMTSLQGINLAGPWWRGLEYMIGRALGRCARCKQKDACRDWLGQEHADQQYPAYCPNVRTIEACRIMDPKAPALGGNELGAPAQVEHDLAELLSDPIIQQLMA